MYQISHSENQSTDARNISQFCEITTAKRNRIDICLVGTELPPAGLHTQCRIQHLGNSTIRNLIRCYGYLRGTIVIISDQSWTDKMTIECHTSGSVGSFRRALSWKEDYTLIGRIPERRHRSFDRPRSRYAGGLHLPQGW